MYEGRKLYTKKKKDKKIRIKKIASTNIRVRNARGATTVFAE